MMYAARLTRQNTKLLSTIQLLLERRGRGTGYWMLSGKRGEFTPLSSFINFEERRGKWQQPTQNPLLQHCKKYYLH
jgi:hypothetical protein